MTTAYHERGVDVRNSLSDLRRFFSESLFSVGSSQSEVAVSPTVVAGGLEGISAARYPWFKPVLRELYELTRLSSGWDSYSAAPTTERSVSTALGFLIAVLGPQSPRPYVIPLSDGGIQLEWHQDGYDIEVSWPTSREPEAYVCDIGEGEEFQLDPRQDFDAVLHFVRQLKG